MMLRTCLLTLLACTAARADVQLPPIFGDHMVVQQGVPLPVWGSAGPGESVEVALANRTARAVADEDGRWRVTLEPINAPGPHTLSVRGNNSLECADVLAGEVWLCSGQSNMEWNVTNSNDPAAEIAAADHPRLRMFLVKKVTSDVPLEEIQGRWIVASPESVPYVSAVGYFFGRDLLQATGGNVGIIVSAHGGSTIEAWLPHEQLETIENRPTIYTLPHHQDAALHHGMIEPLMPYAVRGFAWYQGESNGGSAFIYGEMLEALIEHWRVSFAGPDEQPFLVVQLANSGPPRPETPVISGGSPLVREHQRQVAQRVPGVGLVVAIDIGQEDIHPPNKQDVARRLTLQARRLAYGEDVVADGPQVEAARPEGDGMVLTFKPSPSPLQLAGEAEGVFAVGDDDGYWVWASPQQVDETTIRLTWDGLPGPPTRVRYAFQGNPKSVLQNAAGLPASPFQIPVQK